MEACSRWKRLIMVNSMQASEAPQERMSAAWRLHKRVYEPRRGSVVVKTIDATTTDRLRRSPLYLDLSPSCARKRACMELTTICRFQRLKNPPLRLFQCFRYFTSAYNSDTILNINHFIIRVFFAVERRAVFILGAKRIALVRGWRWDCVVGGMETRFQ